MIRVATYNIRHASLKGLDAIASTLRATRAEIFALQEVDRGVPRSGAVDQAETLGKRLGCHSAFARAFDLDGGAYGLALLSRHPIRSTLRIPLPGPRALPSFGGEARIALLAEVELPGATLGVAVTHLGLHPAERVEQMEALLLALHGRERVLILGDLNEGRTEAAHRLCAATYVDCLEEAGCAPLLSYPSDTPTIAIDHVLRSKDLPAATACNTLPSLASDHLPVVVTLG